ncbi:MAG TPA: hypothetical protein VNO13_02455 [Candidatus Udaeobacter sp.]|nr:hypothetical protein [Candidatus Udaeobacter sp.]
MKKISLAILLIPLLLLELLICTGLLPLEWQQAISERIPLILSGPPDNWSGVTHPRMDLELEEVFRHHLSLRIAYYVIVTLLLAANTVVIRFVWQRLRGSKRVSASRS